MSFRLACLAGAMLLPVIFPAASGRAQPAEGTAAWSYRAWQTDEGLPDNSVTGVAQSADGYLWVATYGGPDAFQTARIFPRSRCPAYTKKSVRTMLQDHQGRLWLGLDPGSVVCLESNSARVFTGDDGMPAETGRGDGGRPRGRNLGHIFQHPFEHALPDQGRAGEPFLPRRRVCRKASMPGWRAMCAGEMWFSKGGQVGVVREGKLQQKNILHGNRDPDLRRRPGRAVDLRRVTGVEICRRT